MNKFVGINYNHWTQLGYENYEGYHSLEFIYKGEQYIICPDMMAYHINKDNKWYGERSGREILSSDINDYFNLMCMICVGINMR